MGTGLVLGFSGDAGLESTAKLCVYFTVLIEEFFCSVPCGLVGEEVM
jgi:hypothetical protein